MVKSESEESHSPSHERCPEGQLDISLTECSSKKFLWEALNIHGSVTSISLSISNRTESKEQINSLQWFENISHHSNLLVLVSRLLSFCKSRLLKFVLFTCKYNVGKEKSAARLLKLAMVAIW